jgi:hypothetical protein
MRIILLLLSLASILPAQESARTCRILFPNAPQQPAGRYFLFDGKASQEVTLPRLSFSPVYKLRPGDIRIWLVTSPVSKPEELPPGSPEVTVGADIRDLYLLVTTDPDNRVLPLRMKVVNANSEKIGRGEMLWFNLTSKHLAGKVGRSSLQLAPNANAMVKEPAASHEDYRVEIYFRVPGDDRTHPLIESQWHHDPRSRYVVFVYDEGRRRAPRIMSFSDFRMPEKKEGE